MPDVSKPPLHTLPYDELLEKLRRLTNLRVVPDPGSPTGYRVEPGPFPGWADMPEWSGPRRAPLRDEQKAPPGGAVRLRRLAPECASLKPIFT